MSTKTQDSVPSTGPFPGASEDPPVPPEPSVESGPRPVWIEPEEAGE